MSDAQERTHKRFSPSQRERNFLCKGSANLLLRTPARPSSDYAIEGTKAHDVLEAGLRNGVRRAVQAHREFSAYKLENLDTGIGNSFYLAIQIALNYVYDILDEYPDAQLFIENYVHVPLEAAPGEGDGYSDLVIYIPSIRKAYVIDYKHGAGIAKDVIDNKQVRQYSVGVFYGDPCIIDPDSVDVVTEVIIQPRAFHKDGYIRENDVAIFDIWLSIDEINEEVKQCLEPTAPLTPGDDQCRFCDANTTCPAREAMSLSLVNQQFGSIYNVVQAAMPAPQDLDVARLGYIYAAAPLLKKYLEDVEKHVLELSRMGVYVPGSKLVEPQPKRHWFEDENTTAFKLAGLTGLPVTDFYEIKLVNITTAQKLVTEAFKKRVGRGRKKQAAEDAKNSFAFLTTKKPSGNVVLVREDDERPAVNFASRGFDQLGYIAPPSDSGDDE